MAILKYMEESQLKFELLDRLSIADGPSSELV